MCPILKNPRPQGEPPEALHIIEDCSAMARGNLKILGVLNRKFPRLSKEEGRKGKREERKKKGEKEEEEGKEKGGEKKKKKEG